MKLRPKPPESFQMLSEREITAILSRWPAGQSLDAYMVEVQKQVATAAMEQEVEHLCGPRYPHDPTRHYERARFDPGAIRVRSEWVPMQIPRVRDTFSGKEKPLQIYQRLRELSEKPQTRLVDIIFRGLRQRNYTQVAQECAESFGLSAPTVSRIFKARTAQILHEFEARDLSAERYVVVMMDATMIRNKHIMIGGGITQAGTKTVLGFAELSTENTEAIEGLLLRMIEQGLRYDQGILFMVDGAKGIHSAITAVFGHYAQIQRCTQHKRENIKGYLRGEKKSSIERQLNAVYFGTHTYREAMQELEAIQEQLENDGYTEAANSLREGLEDTLTLHRLGVHANLRSYLRTTNIMESLNATIKERYRKIRRWTSSEQCHRWGVMGLLEVETKVQNIPLTEDLAKLQKALREQVS